MRKMLRVLGWMIIMGGRFWKEVKMRLHVVEPRYIDLKEFHE